MTDQRRGRGCAREGALVLSRYGGAIVDSAQALGFPVYRQSGSMAAIGGRMRKRLLLATVLAVSCGPTEEQRQAERNARWTFRLSVDNERLARRICEGERNVRCEMHEKATREVSQFRAKYVEACCGCASAERCEDEARRIAEGRAQENETACPG
jgi:hypothetical protein